MNGKGKEQKKETDGFLGSDLFKIDALLNFKWKFLKYLKILKCDLPQEGWQSI